MEKQVNLSRFGSLARSAALIIGGVGGAALAGLAAYEGMGAVSALAGEGRFLASVLPVFPEAAKWIAAAAAALPGARWGVFGGYVAGERISGALAEKQARECLRQEDSEKPKLPRLLP